jgi:paraquat-inducible protein B
MITWFVSSISRLFGGRRRQRPMDRAPVPPSVLNLHLPVGEEEIAPPRLEGPPDSNANLAPIDPHALAGAVASFILPRMAKLLSQQGNEISSSTKKALEDLNPVIGDNFTFHGKKVGDDVLRRLDKQCRLFQAMIERSVTPMGERIADSMRNEIASHLTTLRREVTESCSAATQRAALKPIVDQLIALYDRINDEREFLNSAYRREPDLTLHLGSRQLQERGDAAVRSFAAEVLIIHWR